MCRTLNDSIINGVGKIGGGDYRDIEINGAGKIEGDINCESLTIDGSGKCEGKVYSKEIDVNGAGKFTEEIHFLHMSVDGACSCVGNLNGGNLDVDGVLKVEKNIKGNNIDVGGTLKVEGDLEGESITVNGVLKVEGLLNGESIDLDISANSKIKEIGGSRINIEIEKIGFLNGILGFKKVSSTRNFNIEVIEGNNIELLGVKAHKVIGNNVIIREGCEIDVVEYIDNINVSPDAIIGKVMQ